MILENFNRDQLNGLAKLCFDLAKGAFLIALFPAPNLQENYILASLKVILGLVVGLAFTYIALVLLKSKEQTEI